MHGESHPPPRAYPLEEQGVVAADEGEVPFLMPSQSLSRFSASLIGGAHL